jgi:hypothetical protein
MDLSRVSRRIDRFRTRLRAIYLVLGLSRVFLAATALLFLSLALDYLLNLPLGVRIASCIVAILAVAVVFLRSVVYPLSVRFTDDDLALAAEARLPELEDRLISALQFRRRVDDPDDAESPEMMRAVIEEAGRLEAVVGAVRLTNAKRVRREALAASSALLLLVLFAAIMPSAFGTWIHRNLLLKDMDWPRATTLVVLGFEGSIEKVVTRGQSVRVDVRAEGRVPDDVEIWFERLDGKGGEDRRRMYQVEGREELFRFEFRQVPASFRFWVVGGDDTDGEPVYTVKALVPPTIEQIEARLTYPDYTGMEPETLREADLDLPLGTRVEFVFRANMELRSARLEREELGDAPLTVADDRRTLTTALVADRTFWFTLHLVGEDGQKNLPDRSRFRIRAVPDRKPLARVLHPAGSPWHTVKALVPVKLLASDNYGVARLSFAFKKGSEDEFSLREFAGDELSAPPGAKEIVGYSTIPITDLAPNQENPVRIGDEIRFLAEAEDNNGNTDRTEPYRIEVVSEEDMERRLSQQQANLRDQAMKTRHVQEQAHRAVVELLDFLTDQGKFERRDREQVRDIQILQGRVTRDMDRFHGAIGQVLNSYLYNQLANPVATRQVLRLFDAFLREDDQSLTTVFKRELYQELIRAYRAGDIHDPELGILGILIEIIEVALKIADQSSPEAHRELTGLFRGGSEDGFAEKLERVRELQTDILADFGLLDRKMRDWESYAEIIEALREVKQIEGRIKSGAEDILRGRKDEDRRPR